MKRLLCIRLPDWPIQRIVAERPALETKPVVLVETCRAGCRVAACSARARALGVAVGMPAAEVAALAGSASLGIEPHDPAADREGLEKLAVWCGRFSPLVGVERAAAPDSLLLDVTGLAHLFGGEALLADRIVRRFAERRLRAGVAVADTLGAAWAIAHFGREAPFAGGQARPAVVPPGATPGALAPLPIEALRLARGAIDLLHLLGIDRIGQLAALPRKDLTCRFGPELLECLDQAMGRRDEPVPVHHALPECRAEQSFEHPTARRQTVEYAIEQLMGRLARQLVRSGRGAVRIECRLECDSQNVDLAVGLFQPTAAARHLFELVRMRLERVRLPGPVWGVRVRAGDTAPFEGVQQELFAGGRSPKRPRQLAGLVDRLSSRLGRKAVLRARLVSDAQPELACRFEPLVGAAGTGRGRRGSKPRASRPDLPPRPLRLLGRPLALAAASIVPDGPPLRFCLGGREERIAHTWGPERIETGWWRGPSVGRDYYRVETAAGRRYWLFRDLGDGRWFLHGTFE